MVLETGGEKPVIPISLADLANHAAALFRLDPELLKLRSGQKTLVRHEVFSVTLLFGKLATVALKLPVF